MSIRVLHVLPHRGGGGETYVDYLERAPGISHERHYLSSGRSAVSAVGSIPAGWPGLWRRAQAADVLHTHGDVASVVTHTLLPGRPFVATSHGLHLLRRTKGLGGTAFRHRLGTTASAARTFICCSSAEQLELLALVKKVDRSKLQVIYNGVDRADPITEGERTAARDSLSIPSRAFVALFVGRLEPRKGVVVAARGAIHAAAAGTPVILLVAGDGPQADEVCDMAGRVVLPLGHRSDLRPLFAAADVFMQAAEREGMSFAVLEAMAHGLPVLAADVPGNAEAVGDAGILFRPDDPVAVSRALQEVSDQPELLERLAARALIRIETELSANRFVAATQAVYVAAAAREPG